MESASTGRQRVTEVFASNHFTLGRPPKKLQRGYTEEFNVYDDDSVASDASLEYCWSGRPHEAAKYFGPQCRAEFNSRMSWLSHRKDQLLNAAADMSEKIVLDEKPPAVDTLYFPFAPQRPAMNPTESSTVDGEKSMTSVDVISGITGGSEFSSIVCPTGSLSTLSVGTKTIDRNTAPTSPRSKFIASCMMKGLNPRASLILRKNLSSSLDLQHQGMGDALGAVFAVALSEMPYVTSINIADNNLTDVSLHPILCAVMSIPTLTYLNISENKIDSDSSQQLVQYLTAPDCPLRTLVLSKADIDDNECQAFVLALADNCHLRSFDLSYNIVGKSEALNTVKPEIITGGEALGMLLGSSNCHIEELKIGWNMIRLEGAEALADGLAKNCSITHLDLSYNSFGMRGGERLGAALWCNRTIQVLNLQNNNITSSGCFTICVGIEENTSLRSVCFDGNPIGELGAKVLMQLPCICGTRVSVSAARCNLTIKYEKDHLININDPAAEYDLSLDDPFERAICAKLISLVASHPTYEFNSVVYSPPCRNMGKSSTSHQAGKNKKLTLTAAPDPFGRLSSKTQSTRKVHISLIQGTIQDESVERDSAKLEAIQKLRRIQAAAMNQDNIEELFSEFDEDGSGSLDSDELKRLLDFLGLEIDLEGLEEAMEVYDVDGTGELGLPEFQDFIRAQYDEAAARIKSLCEIPVLLEAQSRQRFIPPSSGTIHMSVGDTYTNKNSGKVMTSLDYTHLMAVSCESLPSSMTFALMYAPEQLIRRGTESVAKSLSYSIQHTMLRVREAVHIFNHINHEIHNRAEVAAIILPRMVDCREARFFLVKVMNYDKVIYSRLVNILGNSLRPILGMFDGYYALDLSVYNDRICMAKLMEQSQTFREQCIANGIFGRGTSGDLSQLGDWSSFRNAFMGKVATHISADMFNPMPQKAKLHFDFSGSPKFPGGATAIMSDTRCVNVLRNVSILTDERSMEAAKAQLREMRQQTMNDLKGAGQFKPYINRLQAEAIQLFMLQFYSTLGKREKVYLEAEAERLDGEKQAAAVAAMLSNPSDEEVNERIISTILRQMSSADFDNLSSATAHEDGFDETKGKRAVLLLKGFVKALPSLSLLRANRAKRVDQARLSRLSVSQRKTIVRKRRAIPTIVSEVMSPQAAQTTKPDFLSQQSSFDFNDDSDSEDGDDAKQIISTETKAKLAALMKTEGKRGLLTSRHNPSPVGRAAIRSTRVGNLVRVGLDEPGNDVNAGGGTELSHTGTRSISVASLNGSGPQAQSPQAGGDENVWTPLPLMDTFSNSTAASKKPSALKIPKSFVSDETIAGDAPGTSGLNSEVVMRPSLLARSAISSALTQKSVDRAASLTEYDSMGVPLIRIDPVEMRNQSKQNPKKLKPSDTMEYLQEYCNTITSCSNDSAKAAKLLDALVDVFSRVWILSRHLALAIGHLSNVNTKRTELFGTYRVDLAVALFGRVADVHNFDLVLKEMTPFEIACMRCRIGLLHLFNPMKPEGNITLNLCNREERTVAKMLAVMSVVEPGDNWLDPTFRWTFDKLAIPGWMLTSGWMTEAGMPTKGILSLEYYSGEGRRLKGCVPEISLRKSLLHMVRRMLLIRVTICVPTYDVLSIIIHHGSSYILCEHDGIFASVRCWIGICRFALMSRT